MPTVPIKIVTTRTVVRGSIEELDALMNAYASKARAKFPRWCAPGLVVRAIIPAEVGVSGVAGCAVIVDQCDTEDGLVRVFCFDDDGDFESTWVPLDILAPY